MDPSIKNMYICTIGLVVLQNMVNVYLLLFCNGMGDLSAYAHSNSRVAKAWSRLLLVWMLTCHDHVQTVHDLQSSHALLDRR